jgi:hypothetical protein
MGDTCKPKNNDGVDIAEDTGVPHPHPNLPLEGEGMAISPLKRRREIAW